MPSGSSPPNCSKILSCAPSRSFALPDRRALRNLSDLSRFSLHPFAWLLAVDKNWKEPIKIEDDLAGEWLPGNLRQISGKTPGSHSDASGRRRGFIRRLGKLSFSPYDLPLRRPPVVISGISPESLRVDRLAGRMCSTLCSRILESSSRPPRCLTGWSGFATAAPSVAPREAFLGIACFREENVAHLPGNILPRRGLTSGWGTNAGSNRRAIHRSDRGRPCQPLKFHVIACARGSDGR